VSISKGWPFVREVWHQDEVDSTNDWARRLIDAGAIGPGPALVWADRQTRGRGQGANSWWSDKGSLTASVVLDPEAFGLVVAVRPRVALGVASVVVAAAAELVPGCQAGIRWPNDIEISGRKLGGILVEGVASRGGPRLIIGIGANVATRLEDAPGDVKGVATRLEGGGTPRDLLEAILRRLEPMLRALAVGDPALVATWNRLDTLLGATMTVQVGAERFRAIAEGIDAGGGLRIRRDGRSDILHAGRILRD